MKKGILFLCFYILAFLVMIINSVYIVVNNVFLDISDVPNGTKHESFISPDGTMVLEVYLVESKMGNAVRVTKTENNKTENIFWQTNASKATVTWPLSNDERVMINGIVLDLTKDEIYDCRSMRSIFNDGLMGWDK